MVSAKKLFLEGKKLLEQKNIINASIDAGYIIKKHCKKSRAQLLIEDSFISKAKEKAFFEDINKRIVGIPLQYILGSWEFMSLPFFVKEGVLIPRADTEILVEKVLKLCKDKKNINVVDLCAGSGCIAISLSYYNKDIICIGIDISNKAINLARKNAKLNNVEERVSFINLDILKGYKDIAKENSVDIIVSNPPYIKTEDLKNLDKEILENEPIIALDGGQNGYLFYESIIKNFKATLKKGGYICFECGISQSEYIKELMQKNEFKNIEIIKDYSGIDRVIVGENNL